MRSPETRPSSFCVARHRWKLVIDQDSYAIVPGDEEIGEQDVAFAEIAGHDRQVLKFCGTSAWYQRKRNQLATQSVDHALLIYSRAEVVAFVSTTRKRPSCQVSHFRNHSAEKQAMLFCCTAVQVRKKWAKRGRRTGR